MFGYPDLDVGLTHFCPLFPLGTSRTKVVYSVFINLFAIINKFMSKWEVCYSHKNIFTRKFSVLVNFMDVAKCCISQLSTCQSKALTTVAKSHALLKTILPIDR